MIRLFLSIIIVTLLIVYVISPLAKYIRKLLKKESARILKSYGEEEKDEKQRN